MILVIDANILFSTLIKDSFAAKIIFKEDLMIYTPEFIIEEFLGYEDLILEKTSRTKEDFIQAIHMLKDIINVVPKEEYSEFMDEAEKISPDDKDIMYLALALKLKCPLWSNDKVLKKQDRIEIITTEELKNILK